MSSYTYVYMCSIIITSDENLIGATFSPVEHQKVTKMLCTALAPFWLTKCLTAQ